MMVRLTPIFLLLIIGSNNIYKLACYDGNSVINAAIQHEGDVMFESENGYNFQKLKEAILSRSVAKDWDQAKSEWELSQIYIADQPESCLCGHTPIIEICVLINRLNGNHATVGNRCVNRFLGLRSDLIFSGIKLITTDINKSLNTESTAFFYDKGVITKWEYDFQANTHAKRNLSIRQMETRRKINIKVLNYIQIKRISI